MLARLSVHTPAIVALLSILLLTGCGLFGPQTRITTEADSYARAQDFLEAGNYNLAIEQLEAMENRFPFGAYATQVQLDLIYAHYERRQYDRAMRRANRFIRLQPAHPRVDYVYYMRGLIRFGMAERTASLLSTRNPVDRDVSGYDETFQLLDEFLDRFPNSDYRDDAKGIMQVARTRMAEHSFNVALYYYQVDRPEPALTRLQKLLSEFPGEPVQDNALALKIRTHEKQGDEASARNTEDLLRTEFPDSEFLVSDELVADFRFRRPWYFWLTLGLVG
ncbi:MAG: outer membrane protein assembly factor BamD [Natronospirillum sp.]|uniref:outer membrane protein assembly factor BamD n=1 Tax=Natronospirillum sp. TaxID=2812955 RepID=UPI0025D8C3FB|nr:outer membrane protein assembly factor BamD [Natronospirillum sp.]MCH8551142.1 outer membrane protein assembly factor BamD [Natronospirillum sp.]